MEEADRGEEALAAARAKRPGLVLIDVGLPDINGFEVCQQLRDEFGDDVPIIFVSGDRTAPVGRAAGFLVGGDDYLVKPVDRDESPRADETSDLPRSWGACTASSQRRQRIPHAT